MKYYVKVDRILSELNLSEDEICFTLNSTFVHIRLENIIGCQVVPPYFIFRQYALYLWYIQEEGKKLTKTSIHISGDENECGKLKTDIQEKLKNISKRPKSLLILINPIGGNKTAQKDYRSTVEPVFKMAGITCDVIVSQRKKHMVDIVLDYNFKGTDGIVILGGDGSFTEVVNVLMRKEQEKAGINIDDPEAKIRPITIPIGIIPTGSGNFIAARSTKFRDVLNSTLHVIKGSLFQMNMIGVYADNRLLSYAGVTAAYRGFTDLVYFADLNRWLGRMRYLVVPLWLSFFKPYLKTFEAEITYYGNITETCRDQNTNQKEILIEGKKVERVKTYSKNSVVVDGKFKSLLMGNLNENDEMDDQVFTSTNFDDSMTELQFLGYIKDALSRKDGLSADFVAFIPTKGVKMVVKYDKMDDVNDDDTLQHLIMIDGEMYEVKELEFQYWLHQKAVPLYTSAM